MSRANRNGYPAARRRAGGAPPPGAVTLADKSKPPAGELGSAAEVSFGGLLSDFLVDYNVAWQLPTRWSTARKMITDPAVSACIAALTFPVLAASLEVEPASDTPEDRKLAEFVENNLANMTVDLQRHRMEALGAVAEGVRVFEHVFEEREGTWNGERRPTPYWCLRKLAIRPNRTIQHWHLDAHGGPDGITQRTPAGDQVEIKMDRLLAFTHMGEGPSLLGEPALRAMYRPWYLLDKLGRIGAIAIERHGSGIPYAQYTGGSTAKARELDQALMGIHTNERAFFRYDASVAAWGIKGVEGDTIDPVPFMEYQRRDMFLANLAQFLALQSGGLDGGALSEDQSGLFMLLVRFIAEAHASTYTRHLVPRMIGYNWEVSADHMPHVKHGVIDQRKALDWANALAKVVEANVILPADKVRETAARLLGIALPEPIDQGSPDMPDVNDPTAPEDGSAPTPEPSGPSYFASVLDGQGRLLLNDHVRTKAEERARNRDPKRKAATLARERARNTPGLLKDKCSVCGSRSKLAIHHTTASDSNKPSNVQTVCARCHNEWSGYTNVTGGGNQRITKTKLNARRRQLGKPLMMADGSDAPTTAQNPIGVGARPATRPRLESEIKLEALGIEVDFARMASNLDAGRDRMIRRVTALQAKQAKRLVAIGKRVAAGRAVTIDGQTYEGPELVAALIAGDVDADDVVLKLASRPRLVPYDEEGEAFEDEMFELFGDGWNEVDDELDQQGVDTVAHNSEAEEEGHGRLRGLGLIAAAMLADRMMVAWGSEMARGQYDPDRMSRTLTGAGGRLLADLASRLANVAMATGRAVGMRENDVARVLYSAAMDGNTCDPCRNLDGREFDEAKAPDVPNLECEGGDRCRCELIPVLDNRDRGD